jgi:sulfatase maturation enzyme AslB (radical SAM superfamily)
MNKHAELGESYWSCEWLEGGLTFSSQSLHACCVTHHDGLGAVKLAAPYAGERLNERELLATRDAVTLRNQQPSRDSACAGCGMLKLEKWPVRKYSFDLVNLSHFTKCNLKCYYCYSTAPGFIRSNKPYRILPIVQQLVSDKLLSPEGAILWGGGEPTLLQEFDEVFDFLQAYGTRQMIHTNAVILSRAILAALPTMKGSILTSVDAGTRETFKKIKGVNAFDRVLRNLREYAHAASAKVTAKIILTPENCGEVMEFLDAIEDIGVRAIRVDVDNFAPVLTPEIVDAAKRLATEARLRGMRVDVGGAGLSGHPEEEMQIKVTVTGDGATWKWLQNLINIFSR